MPFPIIGPTGKIAILQGSPSLNPDCCCDDEIEIGAPCDNCLTDPPLNYTVTISGSSAAAACGDDIFDGVYQISQSPGGCEWGYPYGGLFDVGVCDTEANCNPCDCFASIPPTACGDDSECVGLVDVERSYERAPIGCEQACNPGSGVQAHCYNGEDEVNTGDDGVCGEDGNCAAPEVTCQPCTSESATLAIKLEIIKPPFDPDYYARLTLTPSRGSELVINRNLGPEPPDCATLAFTETGGSGEWPWLDSSLEIRVEAGP